jgi:hypothetical protein
VYGMVASSRATARKVSHHAHFPEMAEDTSESHPLEHGTSTENIPFLNYCSL